MVLGRAQAQDKASRDIKAIAEDKNAHRAKIGSSDMSNNLNSTSQYGPQLNKLQTMGIVAAIAGIVIAGGTMLGTMNAPANLCLSQSGRAQVHAGRHGALLSGVFVGVAVLDGRNVGAGGDFCCCITRLAAVGALFSSAN